MKSILLELLGELFASSELAAQGLPEAESLLPLENGLTLLDIKNEIFLTYLQTLALRNLNVLRSLKDGCTLEDAQNLNDEITKKLVEQRTYMDRGVRPLEHSIKYQMDKAVKAADEEAASFKWRLSKNMNGHTGQSAMRGSFSESDSIENQGHNDGGVEIDDLSYRPDPRAFAAARDPNVRVVPGRKRSDHDVYKPPRLFATSMVTIGERERKERRPRHSAVVDDYIATELSNAPIGEPSIGSTIAAGGRGNTSARQIMRERERREYEETNLVRLSKATRDGVVQNSRSQRHGGFGGEEWTQLGNSIDRIATLTRKMKKDSELARSRKRALTEDGQRGEGIGNSFNIRKRRFEKTLRR